MKKKLCYNTQAVLGLGYGDEGKGVVVDSLCQSLDNVLVIRFSGGQQAGHTVKTDSISHVFSNFGSGTLRKVPTYWSKYCTFDPVGAVNELNILKEKGINPVLYIDKKCPITTPYDIFSNQLSNETFRHGTCGVGVGTTVEREKRGYSLLVEDLFYKSIFKIKLELIEEYYEMTFDKLGTYFFECCERIKSNFNFFIVEDIPSYYDNYIFEGSQGLLLDQNIGFFPHVTRSNTGTKNILEMAEQPYLYLVTRAFQTRHGNGPMTNTHRPHNIKVNPHESNIKNTYQGDFRTALLDLDLLKYGIERDDYIRETPNKELIITCMDLVEGDYRYTVDDMVVTCKDKDEFAKSIADYLEISKVTMIASPYGRKIDINEN